MTESRRPRQLHLFGSPDPELAPPSAHPSAHPPPAGSVQPAAVEPDTAALAARLPDGLRLGTSSWSFPGWNGLVYADGSPAAQLSRHGLRAYGLHPLLRTVGLDRTFYAPLPEEEYARLANDVPAEFRFLVKAFAECTSPVRRGAGGRADEANPRYLDADAAIDLVVAPAVTGLGARLGQLVFQFPPQGPTVTRAPRRFAERLHAFLAALPRGPSYAVELRDRALLTAAYAEALRAAKATHCYSLHPRMPELAAQRDVVPADGPIVVRWMLRSGLGYEQARRRYQPFSRLVDPDPRRRSAIAALCNEALAQGLPVTVVVNNKAEGSAPQSVLELARAIDQLRTRAIPGS